MAILLCTFNGERFLSAQLDSFLRQTYSRWELWVSDDGSSDRTLSLLEDWKVKNNVNSLGVISGPGNGVTANFLSLIYSKNIDADYFAFSDQDDIWDSDKLERALRCLQNVPENVPALYCSRTRLIDAKNSQIGLSPLCNYPPSFKNALIQNLASGNSMIFNQAARALLCDAGCNDVVLHDWWTYLLVCASGGQVFYDQIPTLSYRQHGANLVGGITSFRSRLRGLWRLIGGRHRAWNDKNLHALAVLRPRMTSRNQHVYDSFVKARNSWLLPRLIGICRSGVYRQNRFGFFELFIAALLKKV